jgi:hypothetical protein
MNVLILNRNNQLINIQNSQNMKPHYRNLRFLKTSPLTFPLTQELEQNHLYFFYQSIIHRKDAYLNSGAVARSVCDALRLSPSYHGIVGSLLLETLQRTNPVTVGLPSQTTIIGSKGIGEKCFHYFPK